MRKHYLFKSILNKKMFLFFLFFSLSYLTNAQVLVWEENFNSTTIDQNLWTFEVGDGCDKGICGWGNRELQTYTNRPENARIENGNLVLEARRENYQNKSFTSARLKTEGKLQFKYGTLEARIKISDLRNGLWPAFWTLGAVGGTWPKNGEIDILEMGSGSAIQAGKTNQRAGGAVHWEANNNQADYGTHYDNPTDLTDGFHIYKLVWTSQFIKFFLDDHEYFSIDISGASAADLEEFHNQHFMILNLAVGGQYTGILDASGITAPFPGKMEVDYVKLYQNEGDELFVGKDHAVTGSLGVFTENTPVTARLNYEGDAVLNIWENTLVPITSAVPFEGNEVMAFQENGKGWLGFGVSHSAQNLSNLAENGMLKFQMKTTSTSTYKVGMVSGGAESWVNLAATGEQYGMVRDGQWHEVSIPLSKFLAATANFSLSAVTQSFMFASVDAPAAGTQLFLDNIYYTNGEVSGNAPFVSITSPTNNAVYTMPTDITVSVDASDTDGTITKVDFYNGSVLLGTDSSAPFSFTWPNVPAGIYALTAKATDDAGLTTTSGVRNIIVNATAVGGDFGVYTEARPTNDKLNFGGGANISIWSGTLTQITGASAFEGTEVLAFKENGIGWYGFGIDHPAKNLSGYTSGFLKFQMKTTSTSAFKIGMVSNGVESWVNFTNSGDQYGLVRDGQWHEVSIPLSRFLAAAANFNLSSVTISFMMSSTEAPTPGTEIYLDDIYYTTGTTTGAPVVKITSPTNGGAFTSPASITINADASDANGSITKVEFLQGTTLLGTDEAAPYSFNWTNVASGSYSITARAIDNERLVTSSTVNVTVTAPKAEGNFGIYTEATPVVDKLNYTGDANLYLWDNTLVQITTPVPTAFEGQEVMAFKYNNIGWFGFGIAHSAKDLSAYATGSLKFQMKTTATGRFKIGIVGTGESWVTFENGGEQYGMLHDGQWHEVSIPLNLFKGANFNLTNVTQSFMIASVDAPAANSEYFFDNIYYSPDVAPVNQAPTVSITSPAANASYNAPATITIQANAADADGSITKVEFYSGTTLLGMDETAPYSFTWADAGSGNYSLTAKAYDNGSMSATSAAVAITVKAPTPTTPNLALNKPVTSSSDENPGTPAANAVDGNLATRWASAFADPQWIVVDLQKTYSINHVKITWEPAFARDYKVQISSDNSSWSDLKTVSGNTELVNEHAGLTGTGRYLRIYGTARATQYGYSIYELEVYGTSDTNAGQAPMVALTSPTDNAKYTAGTSITLEASASDSNGTISKVEFYNGSTLLGTDETAPYSYVWNNAAVGTYSLTAKAYDNENLNATSTAVTVMVEAPAPTGPNLALNKPVSVSSQENVGTPGSNAVDGNLTTRWSSEFADPQWLVVDLENSFAIEQVKITWEPDFAKDYKVQISADSSTWTDLATVTGNTELVNTHAGLTGTGRYIRIYGTARALPYGYSLYELEVYGSPAVVPNVAPMVSLTSPANNAYFSAGSTINLQANASDADGTVQRVEFYNGSTLLSTDVSAPYSYSWTKVPTGVYSFTAKAYDNADAMTTSTAVQVTVLASGTKANQTIAFTEIPDQQMTEVTTLQLMATATSNLPVTFTILQGPAKVNGDMLTITGKGLIKVRATQYGNSLFKAAPEVIQEVKVEGMPQNIAFAPFADMVYGQGPIALSATATSGLPVTYKVVSGVATIKDNMLQINGTGKIAVQATQTGNAFYVAAPALTQSFQVSKASQTIMFAQPADMPQINSPVKLEASATSGLAVKFVVLQGPATVNGDMLTLKGTGTVRVKATQYGNGNYLSAPEVIREFKVVSAAMVLSDAKSTESLGLQGSSFQSRVFPNPFSGTTSIELMTPEEGELEVVIFSASGKLVKTMFQGVATAGGAYKYEFDGTGQAAGVYICRITYKGKVEHKRLVLTN